MGNNLISVQRIPIAQFGAIHSLPADVLSTQSKYDVALHEITGALRSVEASTTAIDPDLIREIGAAAKNLAEASAARAASKPEKSGRIEKFNSNLKELKKLIPMAGALGVPVPPEILALMQVGESED